MKKLVGHTQLLIVFWSVSFTLLSAQNLVPNYSFETITTCPAGFGGAGATVAPPWVAPTMGTADIFNVCATASQVDVPANFFGDQSPVTGDGYAGFYCKLSAFEYREYIQAPLLTPLAAGTWYSVSFYVSLSESSCGIMTIGAHFGVTAPTSGTIGPLNVTPQIESNQGYLSDMTNWILVSGCFQAAGGESYITLGNFYGDAETPSDPDCNFNTAYYYIEDILVEEGVAPDEIPVDLGGPVTACFEYEIDPEITEFQLTWEDGSHGPTLTVTESGTYSLTVSDGCSIGVDSIEVTIGGNFEPVDLGPDFLTICNGDSYSVLLDPDLSVYTWQDGSNDSDYDITIAGLYAVTLDDGCATSSDQIVIDVLDPPSPFTLGDDQILCFGDEISFSFDPTLGDFLWQDNSTTSDFTVSSGGTYALTISNMCGMESDEILISDLEVPEIDLGPEELTLCEGEFIEIDIDPSLGDIIWQDGSTEPIYEISSPGIYAVFITNACGTGTDQMDVSVVAAPIVALGADTSLCSPDTLVLTNLFVDGSFLWQDNSTNSEFVVTTPGTYSLTITNFCGSDEGSITVDYFSALLPPDFGPDVSLCPGEQTILYAGNIGADHVWQDLSTADSLLVTGTGTYFVYSSNFCDAVSDTIVVTVNASPPVVDLPDQLSLCQGQSVIIDAGISGVNYLWSDGSTASQLTATSAGTYSLTVSNTCGTDRDTVIVLNGGLAPLVDLGNDINLCAGDVFVLSPTNANVDSWLWHDGSTMPTYSVSAPGLITVQVTNTCGTSFDTINASLLPAIPPFDLGPDTSMCPGQSVVLSITTLNVNILWSNGSTNPSVTISSPGLVSASISNACGSSLDTINISHLPAAPSLNLGPDQSLCPGELITIDPGITNVSYLWHDGSTATTYQTTQAETIFLTITNACGSDSDTLLIIENNMGPQVNLGPDVLACNGDVITIPAGISGVTYLWQDGSTASNFVTSVSGEFILQVSNACGVDTDTIIVDIHGNVPVVDLGPDTSLCEGIVLLLTSNADPETSILWQDGSSLPTFNVTSSGLYSLFESNHCGDATDSVLVSFIDAPDDFTLGPDTTLCPGDMIVLTAPASPFDLLWQDGSTMSEMIADQQLIYWLQISSACGVKRDSVIVDVDTRVPVLNLDATIPWCDGDVITLDATQPFAAEYLWSNGAVSPSIVVSSPDLYSVTVVTLCNDLTDEADVVPGDDCVIPKVYDDVFIPNVFSPNGDGINDVFTISYGVDLDVLSMQGSIYDRWGNLVYSDESIEFGWDGRFAGKEVMSGVYVYTLSITSLENGNEKQSFFAGDITLIR